MRPHSGYQRKPTKRCAVFRRRASSALCTLSHRYLESDMGKYIFAWMLGVPAVVLVGIYLVAHL